MMFGSYNKFHNKINIDAAIVSSLDFITSLIASCVIFSVLGALSLELDVDIEHVAEGGQGLAFVVYPEALSRLPGSWIWAILFFVMLFFLGLDSEFALLETALTAMYDGYPKLRNHKVCKNNNMRVCLLRLPC
jgi:SNF family Na+-dependent transporter